MQCFWYFYNSNKSQPNTTKIARNVTRIMNAISASDTAFKTMPVTAKPFPFPPNFLQRTRPIIEQTSPAMLAGIQSPNNSLSTQESSAAAIAKKARLKPMIASTFALEERAFSAGAGEGDASWTAGCIAVFSGLGNGFSLVPQ